MGEFTPSNVLLTMSVTLFALGAISFIAGLLILAVRANGKDMHTITKQTSSLAQKGMADELAGLLSHASTLVDAMNGLIRTMAGVGVFLTMLGLFLMAIAAWLALQLMNGL